MNLTPGRHSFQSVSREVRMASNGLKLMKEKVKEGTGEQLRTPKVIRKIDRGG